MSCQFLGSDFWTAQAGVVLPESIDHLEITGLDMANFLCPDGYRLTYDEYLERLGLDHIDDQELPCSE